MNRKIRLGFAYPGGKIRLAKWITSFFPKSGNIYLDAFAGRGNVFWYFIDHGKFKSWHLNDIKTKPFFDELKKSGDIVVPDLTKEEYDKYFKLHRSGYNRDAILLEPYLTFSGGGYGAGCRTRQNKGVSKNSYKNKIQKAHEILNKFNVNITALDYREAIKNLSSNDFVYLDPPYYKASVRAYRNDTLDHEEMAKILKDANFKWVLSEYETDMYLDILGKPVDKYEVRLLSTNFKHKEQSKKVECLWTNL